MSLKQPKRFGLIIPVLLGTVRAQKMTREIIENHLKLSERVLQLNDYQLSYSL